MVTAVEYKRHYERFAQNVAYAARTWHHYVYLMNRSAQDKAVIDTLNKAPRFWLDFKYSSVQTTIIFLGKIFDTDSRVFSVDKTVRAAHDDKEFFSKEKLRERKVQQAGEFDGLDEYVNRASELGRDDFKVISAQVKRAKSIWERIKPLRDNIYAHDGMLSNEEREAHFKAVKNDDINEILQILLNISETLLQAEINGRRPNFSDDFRLPIDQAEQETERLIRSLVE